MNKLLKDLYDCFYIPPNFRHRSRKSKNATKPSSMCWRNQSGGWCCRLSMPKIALWRIPPSTVSSLDLNWRGGSSQS